MKLIVAVDNNWGIGYKGELLYSIPQDQKFVREMTTGKVIVMGHSTLKSFPGGKPLKNRTNIVLSRDMNLSIDGAMVCHSVKELFKEISKYQSDNVFVFGGETVYKMLIDYCDTAYVTKINTEKEADSYFVDIDAKANWEMSGSSPMYEYNGIEFVFKEYRNNKVNDFVIEREDN